MKYLHLILMNLSRKKLRTAFTLLSIFVSFLLFGLLMAVRAGFGQGVEVAGVDRLITIHKTSMMQFMPVKYVTQISAIEGVRAVTSWTWFGGYYQDRRNQLVMFATDPEGFVEVFYDLEMPEEERKKWLATRTGLIVGRSVADRFGWKVGDRVPILTNIWFKEDGSPSWDFEVSSIYTAQEGADDGQVYFHYDYLKEAAAFQQISQQLGGIGSDELGVVGMVYSRLEDGDRAEEMIRQIDARFANSPAETKTTTEKAWAQSFANQVGDLGTIVAGIVGVVFFTLLLVAGNTMAQSVRERTSELAVLKTLGFTDRSMMGLVLAESLLLALLGGVPGLLLSRLLSRSLSLELTFIPRFYVTDQAMLLGAVLVVLLGLVTGAVPAWQALRLQIVNALQRI